MSRTGFCWWLISNWFSWDYNPFVSGGAPPCTGKPPTGGFVWKTPTQKRAAMASASHWGFSTWQFETKPCSSWLVQKGRNSPNQSINQSINLYIYIYSSIPVYLYLCIYIYSSASIYQNLFIYIYLYIYLYNVCVYIYILLFGMYTHSWTYLYV